MKSHHSPPIAVFCTILSSAAIGACLDFTPIAAVPSDAGTPPDVMATDAGDDPGPCRKCVESPACGDTFAMCVATPKCVVMFECGAAQDCYAPGADLVACLSICGQQAALTGSTDPAVAPFLALYQCATTLCESTCAVP
jgi:hypothetical protein